MSLEREVGEMLKWADEVASHRRTSALNILIEFDRSYKQVQNIQIAKSCVEKVSKHTREGLYAVLQV